MFKSDLIAMFPTMIYSTVLEDHESFNTLIMDNMLKHGFDSQTLITGEPDGKSTDHCDPAFYNFFKQISFHVEQYANQFSLKENLFDYFVTKSWYVIVNNTSQRIKYHVHSAGHFSFVYYACLPPLSDILSFSNQHEPNAFFDGLFDTNPDPNRNLINDITEFNCKSYSITPQVGQLIIFPSKLPHGTIRHPDNVDNIFPGKRVGISGDVNMLLKPQITNFESGKLNWKHWRKF